MYKLVPKVIKPWLTGKDGVLAGHKYHHTGSKYNDSNTRIPETAAGGNQGT